MARFGRQRAERPARISLCSSGLRETRRCNSFMHRPMAQSPSHALYSNRPAASHPDQPMNNAFFSDLLTSISERGRTLLRRAGSPGQKQTASDLIELCEALLSGAGEASGTAMAREVLDRYQDLDPA